MFGFFSMAGNYEDRKVGRWNGENNDFVSTALVTDSLHPYETAICHPDYNNGNLIIVEMYASKKDAIKGHEKWVKVMTSDKLPDSFVDVSSSEISQLQDVVSECPWRVREKTK